MSFPIGPVNNQTAVVNGITYVYSSANNAWTRVTATNLTLAGNLTTGGNVTIAGNLTVQGNTTTLNTETLTVEDLNITVANGAATSAAADGAGLTVDGANARLLYKSATDSWVFDRGVFSSGNLVANSGTTSSSVTTGALVVVGGMGVAGNIYSGANVVITNGIFWASNGLAYSSAGSGNNPFDSDSNLGMVTGSVTSSFDLGLTTDASVTEFYELGTLVSNSVIYGTSIIANTISGATLITGTNIAAGFVTASSVTSAGNVTGANLISTGSANIAGNTTTANLLIANVTISANIINPSAAQINGVDIATVNNINDINNVYDLDDISGYTNGIRQVFTLSYNLSNVTLSSPWQLSVAVNGIPLPAFNSSPNAAIVWQSYVFPANKGYTLGSNSTIKFTEAPVARSDVYMRKQPGSTPSVIKIYPFKPIDIMIGY